MIVSNRLRLRLREWRHSLQEICVVPESHRLSALCCGRAAFLDYNFSIIASGIKGT
jgi:hypothetical protein